MQANMRQLLSVFVVMAASVGCAGRAPFPINVDSYSLLCTPDGTKDCRPWSGEWKRSPRLLYWTTPPNSQSIDTHDKLKGWLADSYLFASFSGSGKTACLVDRSTPLSSRLNLLKNIDLVPNASPRSLSLTESVVREVGLTVQTSLEAKLRGAGRSQIECNNIVQSFYGKLESELAKKQIVDAEVEYYKMIFNGDPLIVPLEQDCSDGRDIITGINGLLVKHMKINSNSDYKSVVTSAWSATLEVQADPKLQALSAGINAEVSGQLKRILSSSIKIDGTMQNVFFPFWYQSVSTRHIEKTTLWWYDNENLYSQETNSNVVERFNSFALNGHDSVLEDKAAGIAFSSLDAGATLAVCAPHSTCFDYDTNQFILAANGDENIAMDFQKSVKAVGLDGYLNSHSATVRVYNEVGNLLGIHVIKSQSPKGVFVGVRSNKPISRVVWTTSDGRNKNTGVSLIRTEPF